MDIQALQTELRDYLLNQALNDLSVIRWTLVEERMQGEDGAQYLDALLAYRDAEIAYLRAHKEFKTFIQKHPQLHWEKEEELYYIMGRFKALSTRAEQDLHDLILASDSYKMQETDELPDYG